MLKGLLERARSAAGLKVNHDPVVWQVVQVHHHAFVRSNIALEIDHVIGMRRASIISPRLGRTAGDWRGQLGINRFTLYRKMSDLDIVDPTARKD